ncbi:MAG: hypothetical protein IPK68_17920 [Bdellovibrionales bacterium]|nr:hypothetical protein [Bdellovibrionales bacterium]
MKNLRLIVLSSSLFMSFLAHGKANQPQIGESTVKCSHAKVYGEGSREPQNEKVVVGKWLNGGKRSDGTQVGSPQCSS